MKDEIGGVAIKIFVGLKLKMYSFLVDDNNEYKKSRAVNIAATISHNKYKDVLLYCFDDKIYIQSNRYHGLDLGYLS